MKGARGDHAVLGRLGRTVLAIAVGVAVAGTSGAAAVKVRAEFDKTFDFTQVRTWAWNARAGQVIVARTADDDPEEIQQRAEPLILRAVATELPKRGLKLAAATPDVTLTWYLLLTVGVSAQTMGQFLPAVATWGLPPFAPATTSFEMIERGALVLDLTAKGQVVWRGIGEAKISTDLNQEKRAALIEEAVQEIVKRYPPRK